MAVIHEVSLGRNPEIARSGFELRFRQQLLQLRAGPAVELAFVPLAEAINKVRSIPADSLFIKIARSLGISLGD